ncbi:MAG: DNA polymerase III subunit beta [Candidatus Margulisbacteria bacterium]|nr:DNA polymerase III subunit beta [Candidatus Margulisiibacteriota bacterium]
MEFSCQKKDLQSGMALTERIVTTRSTLPIIGNILFEAGKGGLKISANNLEIGIEIGIKAAVVKGGAILIGAKTLASLVAKLPDEEINFKLTEKGALQISYGESHFSVNTLPPDEFPALAKVKDGRTISIEPDSLVKMIKQTIFSTSTSEDKYVLNGALLDIGKSGMAGDSSNIRLISTDGYRLAKSGEKISVESEKPFNVIVPAKALQEILKILGSGEGKGEVKISLAEDQISIKYDDVYLVSRLIQGQFPDYKQVLPKKTSTKLIINTRGLLESAERAAVIASGAANVVKFEFKNKNLHLLASTPDVGSINEKLEAEVKGKENFQIAFNIRLVTDVLKVIESGKVEVEFTDALGPGLIRPAGDENYLYIVMPIRTQEAA